MQRYDLMGRGTLERIEPMSVVKLRMLVRKAHYHWPWLSAEPGPFFVAEVSWPRHQLRRRQRRVPGFGPALTPLVQT